MLSSFFELDGQKDVQGKHPKLLQLVAVIDTDKTNSEYKKKHRYVLCILGCKGRMKMAGNLYWCRMNEKNGSLCFVLGLGN
jgi:hypothetical protein